MARALARPSWSLYFPARLERLFERETQADRSRHLVGVGILWIAIGVLASLVMAQDGSGHAPFGMNAAVRVGIVTPMLAAVVAAIWRGVRPVIREGLITVACVIAPATMILSVMIARDGDIGANRGALTVILLFITVVVRLRFWFAVVACAALVAVQVGVPVVLGVPVPGSVPLAMITIAATLAANYTLEREYRSNYLQRLHGRIQGAHLAAMVEQLHDLSHRDALTGLANRRAMDRQLEELRTRHEPYSVILVDIDGFKEFNDRYGHQVGDDCLRRVAAMLRASLRFTSDRVARMGGEEFAVVLPGTAVEDARTMAERMRRSILELRIPHDRSPTGAVVSISAGVSASPGDALVSDTLSAADRALYLAKATGRNRVEVATDGLPAPIERPARVPALA